MDLETQIQLLIDNAPRDGISPHLIAAIVPAFRAIAQQLRHSQYYILQKEGSWVLTTLSHRADPSLEKQVIYAFSTIQDVSLISSAGRDPQVVATPIAVTHILFQLIALAPVDSIVFLETPGTLNHAFEVQRSQLEKTIQKHLKQMLKPQQQSRQIPPDIA
ncbi:hypothetical protein [Nostoc sp. PCC 7107]|uniref:hypothetical protein n=1 Tax=Nostoc sp. PCC 7107 TaxID=317936 RepID=UPI00029EC5FD|nr:hypothetical protein [Nostoc sp. PCC 7107]AFY42188.1 hypothetical protein Nos7107_1546 [Nostoc sp. PCC 7107]